MEIVCIDTQILIWGLSEKSKNSQQDNIEKAKSLIENLVEQKSTIIIPSLVCAEFMAGIHEKSPEKFDYFDKKLDKFSIAPFDKRSSIIYSQLRKRVGEDAAERKKRNIDIMILSTAISTRCHTLYTTDRQLTIFTKNHTPIKVKGLSD